MKDNFNINIAIICLNLDVLFQFVNMIRQAEEDVKKIVTQDVKLIKSAVNPLVIALPTSTSSTIPTSSVVMAFMLIFSLH